MPAIKLVTMLGMIAGATAVQSVTEDNSVMCANWATKPTSITTTPKLEKPEDIAVDGNGDIFVVDNDRKSLIKVDGNSPHESTVLLNADYLQNPIGLAISPTHADLYVGDAATSTIWQLRCQHRNSNFCTQYYDKPLNLSLSHSVHPQGLQLDAADHLYIADFNGQRVLRRDVNTAETQVLLSSNNMDLGTTKFGPHDIAINVDNHQILVTDINNDDIWGLQCAKVDDAGLACDQYAAKPFQMALTGSSAHIDQPSGITTDLHDTIFVTGKEKGIVAEIKGNASVDLLQETTPGYLKEPVAVAFDSRFVSKAILISDDPTYVNDTHQGLYRLNCAELVCVPLDSRYISHVDGSACNNIRVGSTCELKCASGYSANQTNIKCLATGWDAAGVTCASTVVPGVMTTVSAEVEAADAGMSVAVALVMLVLLAGTEFLFIRLRVSKKQFKTAHSDYTPFGSSH